MNATEVVLLAYAILGIAVGLVYMAVNIITGCSLTKPAIVFWFGVVSFLGWKFLT